MSLFRPESTRARETAWLGRIVVTRPLSFAVLTAATLAIALGMLAFFMLGEYTRKARLGGTLAPVEGIVRILAPQAGRIESVEVAEGDDVSSGHVVITLVDARSGSAAEDAATTFGAHLAERGRSLLAQREHASAAAHAERAALEHRRGGLRRELAQVTLEVDSQARRAGLAREALARARRLEAAGFIASAARSSQDDALLDHLGRLEAVKRTRMALERELGAIDSEIAASAARARAQLAAIDTQRALVEQERFERSLQYRARIVAPSDGTVAAVLAERGQAVAAGATLATLIPSDARLEAHLYAPSRSIGFVRVGQEVLLRYVAYPYQKFGSHRARVTAIARNPLSAAELGFAVQDGNREPLYRIKAELPAQAILAYGRSEPLQPGLQVEADVLLDRRRLIEWIFEPLLSLAGRA